MGFWTDIAVVYYISKKFVTPFKRWKAFELGIIDEKGKVLKKTLKTHEERNSFTILDKLIAKIKAYIGPSTFAGLGILYLLADYKETGPILQENTEPDVFDKVKSLIGKDIHVDRVITDSGESVGISWIENPDGSISFSLGWYFHKYMINSLTLSFIDKLVAKSLVSSLDALFKSNSTVHDSWDINNDRFELNFSPYEMKVSKTTDYNLSVTADLFLLFQKDQEKQRFMEAWNTFTGALK